MSRSRLVVALVLAVTASGRVALTQPTLQVSEDLLRRTQAGERVDVIVGVESTFAPEGWLRTRADVGAQRASVAREVDEVRARVAATGATVGSRFDVIPFFRAQVDAHSLSDLAQTRGVTSIEENRPNRIATTDTVPFVNAPPAWVAGATGAGWNVALLDTGIDGTHPFLSGKIVSEACYSGGGPRASSVCPSGAPSSTAPGSGAPCTVAAGCIHGTSVAGVAVGTNGPGGLSGTAPGAGLISIQVASRQDVDCPLTTPCLVPWDADVLSGLNRVATLAGPSNVGRIAAVNLSLASGERYATQAACDAARPALKAAIDNLRSLGIAVVAGSGNDGATGQLPSPACISSAIAVGATTSAVPVEVPQFSNDAPFLHLLAPGILDAAAVPGGGFAGNSGTSLSVPHVTGAWAILKQAAPNATPAQVLAALTATGTPVAHWSSGLVHPAINVNAARLQLVSAGGAAPGAVTALTVGATGNTLTMSWVAPTAGGAPASYELLARLVHGGPVVATVPIGSVTSISTTAPSGTYVVSVRASNAAGAGAESNPVSVTFPGLPGLPHRPSSFGASVVGDTVTFSWTAPTTGGPVANYLLAAGPAPVSPWPFNVPLPAAATSISFPGVPAGIWYVRLFAQNATGSSGGSNVTSFTVAGLTPPSPPVMSPAAVASRAVTLSWVPGAGGPPTSYVLTAALSPGGAPIATVQLSTSVASFPDVPTGTYYVRVAGVNGAGTSGPSNEVAVVVQ